MNRNAFIGRNVEILFKNSVGDNPSVVQKIQEHFNIEGRYMSSISTGIHSEKCDVKMEFADGHNIDVNIKAYKKSTAFNQLTRTSLSRFCEKFNLGEIQDDLYALFLEKSKNSKSFLFPIEQRDKWVSVFQKIGKSIIKWSLSEKKSKEIIALYEREDSNMTIYPMSEVLDEISTSIGFTRGGNIQIGNSITFQRKGGNGVHAIHIPKTDPKHPGNNVQIKMRMDIFETEAKDLVLAKYHI